MTHENIPDYLKPYQDAVREFGGTFDATLWRSREGQELRFKVFSDRIDFHETSVLDIGCGVGDFAVHLIELDTPFLKFHGIDAMDAMIQTAGDKNLPRCTFETCDIVKNQDKLQGYDWITCSGTLNAMPQTSAMELISAAFQACRIGVAFNFLSNKNGNDCATEDLTPASRFHTIEMLEHGFALTPLLEFTQSYLAGHDASVILRKQEKPQ